jgi:hypothetical protein
VNGGENHDNGELGDWISYSKMKVKRKREKTELLFHLFLIPSLYLLN